SHATAALRTTVTRPAVAASRRGRKALPPAPSRPESAPGTGPGWTCRPPGRRAGLPAAGRGGRAVAVRAGPDSATLLVLWSDARASSRRAGHGGQVPRPGSTAVAGPWATPPEEARHERTVARTPT